MATFTITAIFSAVKTYTYEVEAETQEAAEALASLVTEDDLEPEGLDLVSTSDDGMLPGSLEIDSVTEESSY